MMESWQLQRGSVADRAAAAQRVDDEQVLTAYQAYLDHLEQAECGVCPELLEGRCAKGQSLWATYKETMRP